jgi:hypothetical protein
MSWRNQWILTTIRWRFPKAWAVGDTLDGAPFVRVEEDFPVLLISSFSGAQDGPLDPRRRGLIESR